MNLVLFITVLIVSFIAVRIGAIAFQLTGIEWSLAKFQALSCFTATGFTTKESELIMATPQRRRIASILIVLGHAGFVTMIATFANSLRPPVVKLPFLSGFLSSNLMPLINLTIIVVVIYIIYRIFTNSKFARKLTDALRKRMVKRDIIKSVSFEELAIATGGYGVSKVAVGDACVILDKTLSDAQVRQQGINILAIVRNDETIPNPSADTRIIAGDELICFGKLENIRKQLCLTPHD
ncbi:MAG: TrkA C-terminal domain-containing protein [Phycisphaerae bacterium]|nr:TrkA C-terminal domain-containing protein [Phycisphaerae bacterium]MDD5380957.1 TrkA C-terminal domain-containing protein [Phycisphaerae bacterium]